MNINYIICIFVLFILINEILYAIIDILILPFSIWTTTALKVLYCIYM